MTQLYNARDIACKSPYGAVPAGTEIQFSLYPKRREAVQEIRLLIVQEGNPAQQSSIRLQWNGLAEDCDCYHAAYTVANTGLYWYYFYVRTAQKSYYVSRGFGSCAEIGAELKERFQITVYDGKMTVPEWFGQGITYHIFPDRFYRTQIPAAEGYPAERVIHENWEDIPAFLPNAQGEILNHDFFGGNLRGIQEKLPLLAKLHVKTLYLSPIFEAYSNHRYDTGNYRKIDPMLGSESDFEALCAQAKQYGIHILLDGVFNHTGVDSLYFNGCGHYDSLGASQSKQSPYYEWYDFTKWPQEYSAWWGIPTLPQVRETCDSYLDYIVRDNDSVVRHWLRLGASGWRLDVADELPDCFIAALRTAARQEKADALILGEVWEDASHKIAYEKRRTYLQGAELDSVMNYPLRNAILQYLNGEDAKYFAETIETLHENYPQAIFYSLMNVIGTHDTPRILSVLGSDSDIWEKTKEERAAYTLQPKAYAQAVRKLKIAVVLQFTLPGSPCIYYGDEAGMEGYEDPLNRRTYPWGKENQEIFAYYEKLCTIRAESDALCSGTLQFLYAEDAVLVFSRQTMQETIIVAVNRDTSAKICDLPFDAVHDILLQKTYLAEGNDLSLTLMPESASILRASKR